jgi:hypothetical protein
VSRATVEGCRKLDVRKLARRGWLDGQRWLSLGDAYLLEARASMVRVIRPASGGARQETLLIVRTQCPPFGGSRPWFLCPAHGCNRRAAILYSAGGHFACRRCHGLAYRTQHEHKDGRLLIKAERQWARLGWGFGEEGQKPKGTYWRTFSRIADRAANAYEASLHASRFMRRFARMQGR